MLATQNPFDHEGTFPLPEAQLDRFLFKLRVEYPTREDERRILRRHLAPQNSTVTPVVDAARVLEARDAVTRVYVDDSIVDYVQRLAAATRWPAASGIAALQPLLRVGASPRAAARWLAAARAAAYLDGRSSVLPDDVVTLAYDVLRHRLVLSLDAEADGVSVEQVIEHLVGGVAGP